MQYYQSLPTTHSYSHKSFKIYRHTNIDTKTIKTVGDLRTLPWSVPICVLNLTHSTFIETFASLTLRDFDSVAANAIETARDEYLLASAQRTAPIREVQPTPMWRHQHADGNLLELNCLRAPVDHHTLVNDSSMYYHWTCCWLRIPPRRHPESDVETTATKYENNHMSRDVRKLGTDT